MAEKQSHPAPSALPPLLARAMRLVPEPPPGNAIADLAAGLPPGEVSARRGLPRATVLGIRSFYEQLDHVTRACSGTACRFGGADALRERLEAMGPVGDVRCLGHCYAAPAFRSGDKVYACPPSETVEGWLDEWGEGPSPMVDLLPTPRTSLVAEPVALRRLLPGRARDPWSEYELPAGEAILAAVEAAALADGDDGAGPVAARWRAVRDAAAGPRWVVANGDEGDPGSYVGRMLLEEDPHAVLAGLLACARAVGAQRGVVHVRAEYPRAIRAVRAAIAAARERGALGPFAVDVCVGAGSYVCGEDSALVRSIEGLRGEPSPGLPPVTERGLFGRPTVVQDVASLALVPWVARHGRAPASRAVCLAGAVRRPGVVEIPVGLPLRELLERAGGGAPDGRRWGMALVGGPLGRVLPASRFDTPLSGEALPGMGHAGVVVLDDTVSPRALAEHVFAFAAAESCGACLPCRIGTARLARVGSRTWLERLLETLEIGGMCRFGRAVPRPVRDLLAHFGSEVLP